MIYDLLNLITDLSPTPLVNYAIGWSIYLECEYEVVIHEGFFLVGIYGAVAAILTAIVIAGVKMTRRPRQN